MAVELRYSPYGLKEPYKVNVIDYTLGTDDPLTARHKEALGGLQSMYDKADVRFTGLKAEHEALTRTLTGNLENLAQLDAEGVVSLVENNIDMILIVVIMYFLMGE